MNKTNLRGFEPGDRVELHPATDRWMSGDRYGTITKVGRKLLHVKMDVSGRTIHTIPALIGRLNGVFL